MLYKNVLLENVLINYVPGVNVEKIYWLDECNGNELNI